MSGVILKCPNCGTAQVGPGECDACHDAQVRQFCTNHAPGLWLESPACPRCGARLGEAGRVPRTPVLPVPRRAEATKAVEPARDPAIPTRAPGAGPWRGAGLPRPVVHPADRAAAAREAMARRWPELLRAASGMRRPSTGPTEGPDGEVPDRVRGGCLRPVLLLALSFLIFWLLMSFLLSGAFVPLLLGLLS